METTENPTPETTPTPEVGLVQFAEVALNTHLHQTFTYHIPEALHGQLQPGHLVRVAFRTSVEPGIVLALRDDSPVFETKPIEERIDPRPVVTEEQIALSRWLAETIYAPIGTCLWLWLPPGLVGQRDTLYTLIQPELAHTDSVESKIIEMLDRRGPLRGRQITQKFHKDQPAEAALRALVKNGIVTTEAVLAPPGVRPQKIQTAALAIHPLTINDTEPHLGKDAERYLHILRLLTRHAEPLEVSWVYAQVEGATVKHLKKLAELEFITLGEKETWRDSLAKRDYVPVVAPTLTPGQSAAWVTIERILKFETGEGGPIAPLLLHGVTGSGKTEIYLRAIEATLAGGRGAMLLVPEIAMTAQMVRRVTARFPGKVAVVHSRLSPGELYDTWRRARDGLVQVIVGTRSALFTPLPDLGLICIDEEHDDSYKNFATPHYDTRIVADEMMRRAGGILILGSATPDLETYHRAKNGDYTYLRLPNRIMGHRVRIEEQAEREGVQTRYVRADADPGEPSSQESLTIDLPPVEVVDMREELKSGNTSIFSRLMSDALDYVLRERQQAILFLNRRGSSTFVFCRDCGYIAACPRCDMPLTYHSFSDALYCHHCGYIGHSPRSCPECSSERIKFFGAGTQHVEAELIKQFPLARIVRWDADTASRPDMHDAILDRFLTHQADVMIGTQMIAKGLDLPLVTLVGVISADTALGLPDFRAAERTFQLLTQVAGRAGRGVLGGQVILQTYQPDHYAVQAASEHDTLAFYERELAYRRDLGYPPFRRLARIIFRHGKELRARDEAGHAAKLLREKIAALNMTATEIIGPAPCFFGKVNEFYRWQVIVRSPDPLRLLGAIEAAQTWHIDLDPVDML